VNATRSKICESSLNLLPDIDPVHEVIRLKKNVSASSQNVIQSEALHWQLGGRKILSNGGRHRVTAKTINESGLAAGRPLPDAGSNSAVGR